MFSLKHLIYIVCFLFFLVSISENIYAQQYQKQDVIILKNGEKKIGKIVEQTNEFVKMRLINSDSIQMRKLGKDVVIFRLEEIAEITGNVASEIRPFKINEKGYYGRATWGYYDGSRTTLQTTHGYRFVPQLGIGLGMGRHLFRDRNLITPSKIINFHVDVSGDVTNNTRLTPTYAINLGFGDKYNPGGNYSGREFYQNYGVGCKIRNKLPVDFIFSLSYYLFGRYYEQVFFHIGIAF